MQTLNRQGHINLFNLNVVPMPKWWIDGTKFDVTASVINLLASETVIPDFLKNAKICWLKIYLNCLINSHESGKIALNLIPEELNQNLLSTLKSFVGGFNEGNYIYIDFQIMNAANWNVELIDALDGLQSSYLILFLDTLDIENPDISIFNFQNWDLISVIAGLDRTPKTKGAKFRSSMYEEQIEELDKHRDSCETEYLCCVWVQSYMFRYENANKLQGICIPEDGSPESIPDIERYLSQNRNRIRVVAYRKKNYSLDLDMFCSETYSFDNFYSVHSSLTQPTECIFDLMDLSAYSDFNETILSISNDISQEFLNSLVLAIDDKTISSERSLAYDVAKIFLDLMEWNLDEEVSIYGFELTLNSRPESLEQSFSFPSSPQDNLFPKEIIEDLLNDLVEPNDVIWSNVKNPFCAPTSVCVLLANLKPFTYVIKSLQDLFSSYISLSISNSPTPMDPLMIPQLLWRLDPIEVITSIYKEYTEHCPLFGTMIEMQIRSLLEGICSQYYILNIFPMSSFDEMINKYNFLSHNPIITLAFPRLSGRFSDEKFNLPLTYTFSQRPLNLFGFIYIINYGTAYSHYIAVVKKGDSYFKCDGIPCQVNPFEQMSIGYIVAAFFVDELFEDYEPLISSEIDTSMFEKRNFNPHWKLNNNHIYYYDSQKNDYKKNLSSFNNHNDIIDFSEGSLSDFDVQKNEITNQNVQDKETVNKNDQYYLPSDDLSDDIVDNEIPNQDSSEEISIELDNSSQSINITVVESEDVSLSEFLSVNRFFSDALLSLEVLSLETVARQLETNQKKLREILKEFKISISMIDLKELAQNVILTDPPPVYTFLSEIIHSNEGILVDSRYLEFIIPFSDFHFDYYNLLFNRSTFPRQLKYNIPQDFEYKVLEPNINQFLKINKDNKNEEIRNESARFMQKMIDMYENIPKIFKDLDGDQRFLINSQISIAFLYGNVEIAQAGIGSPHLKGTFSISARKQGTGYLNLDSILNSRKRPDIEKLNDVMNWLKINNPLYAEISVLDIDFYTTMIDSAFAPTHEVIGIATLPNSVNQSNQNQNENTDYNKIPISLPDSDGKKC